MSERTSTPERPAFNPPRRASVEIPSEYEAQKALRMRLMADPEYRESYATFVRDANARIARRLNDQGCVVMVYRLRGMVYTTVDGFKSVTGQKPNPGDVIYLKVVQNDKGEFIFTGKTDEDEFNTWIDALARFPEKRALIPALADSFPYPFSD